MLSQDVVSPATPFYAPFSQLRQSGFTHLLPVIPHDATISAYSKTLHGREGVLGKNPGKKVSDGWVGFYQWQKHEGPDEEEAAEWDAMGASVGLRCVDVVAIDIDVLHDALADIVELEVLTWLGFGPKRIGRAPKRLMVFKLNVPGSLPSKLKLNITDWAGEAHCVEVLGAVQQFVVSGIHPTTGKPYTWDTPLHEVGMDGLDVVSVADVERFLDEVADAVAFYDCETGKVASGSDNTGKTAEGLVCGDMGLLREAVMAVPNDDDVSREYFVQMAHAIRGASGEAVDDGLEIFTEWAEQYPYGQREGEVDRVFESAQEPRVGIQWLLDEARRHGFSGDMAADFGTYSGDDVTGGEADTLASDFGGGASMDDNGSGDAFWEKWCYVNRLKRFVNLQNNAVLDKENFDDLYVALGDDERPSKFFLEHRRDGCWADDVDYRPGDDTRVAYCKRRRLNALNMWSPGPAHGEWVDGQWRKEDAEWEVPGTEALGPWLELGEHLFGERPEEMETLLDWMAWLLQNPGQKPNWHPLIGSPTHGTGKDSFFAPLVQGLGSNVSTIKTQDLEGQWTWWAENVQLVVVSEISSFERRSVMNKLKSYQAAPPFTIEINKKGQPQYEVPNVFGMLMFTNNEDAMALEPSDRRTFVVWSEAGLKSEAFYTYYHEWLERGGAKAVAKWLLARDLSHFSAKGNAPSTDAKEDMRRAALSVVEGTLLEAIESGQGPFACDLLTLSQAHDWLRQRVPRAPTPQKLGYILRSLGGAQLARVRVGDTGERERIYAVRRGGMWSQFSQQHSGPALRDKMLEQREAASAPAGDDVSGAIADFSG